MTEPGYFHGSRLRCLILRFKAIIECFSECSSKMNIQNQTIESELAANIIAIEELALMQGKNQRLIGLDLGSKTIGIALSDGMLSIATGKTTIKRTKFTKDVEVLISLINQYDVFGLVMGMPF